MSSLLALVLLGLLANEYNGIWLSDVKNQSSSQESSPLRNSEFMISATSNASLGVYFTPVLKLISILQWNQVIVLYDPLYTEELQLILPHIRLSSVYDLSEYADEKRQFLQSIHEQFFPKLYFFLLCNDSTALQLLQMVDQFDLESNRTTDFRHFSYWVVFSTNLCQSIQGRFPLIYNLENVLIVSPHGSNETSFVRHLLTIPGGRTCSKEIKLTRLKTKQDVFPNTKYGLNNRTLTVSLLVDEPHVIKTDSGFQGHFIDILQALAVALNFSYKTVHPADMRWGEIVNGRWDGMVGQLERREVDLAVGTLSIHEDREKVMDFLYPPIYQKSDDIMYRLQDSDTKYWQIYLKPFKSSVHILLLVSLVVFTLFLCAIYMWEDKYFNECDVSCTVIRSLYDLLQMFQYLFGILLNRGLFTRSNSQSTRILLFVWGIFSVIMAACYSAQLVAVFAVHKPSLPFNTLGEMVRQKEYKWGFVSGDIREHILSVSRNTDMEMFWNGVLEFSKTDPDVLSENYSVHLKKVRTDKYAFIQTRDKIQRIRNEDCNIHYLGQNIIWHQNGIGVPSDYPLRREIEYVLMSVTDSGLLDIWQERWSRTVDTCFHETSVKVHSLHNVTSAFYLLFAGMGAAGVVLTMECIKHKQEYRR